VLIRRSALYFAQLHRIIQTAKDDSGNQRRQLSSLTDTSHDIFVVNGSLTCLADERIPSLTDNFLQNAYTKIPSSTLSV
jgi:hypothetical protein